MASIRSDAARAGVSAGVRTTGRPKKELRLIAELQGANKDQVTVARLVEAGLTEQQVVDAVRGDPDYRILAGRSYGRKVSDGTVVRVRPPAPEAGPPATPALVGDKGTRINTREEKAMLAKFPTGSRVQGAPGHEGTVTGHHLGINRSQGGALYVQWDNGDKSVRTQAAGVTPIQAPISAEFGKRLGDPVSRPGPKGSSQIFERLGARREGQPPVERLLWRVERRDGVWGVYPPTEQSPATFQTGSKREAEKWAMDRANGVPDPGEAVAAVKVTPTLKDELGFDLDSAEADGSDPGFHFDGNDLVVTDPTAALSVLTSRSDMLEDQVQYESSAQQRRKIRKIAERLDQVVDDIRKQTVDTPDEAPATPDADPTRLLDLARDGKTANDYADILRADLDQDPAAIADNYDLDTVTAGEVAAAAAAIRTQTAAELARRGVKPTDRVTLYRAGRVDNPNDPFPSFSRTAQPHFGPVETYTVAASDIWADPNALNPALAYSGEDEVLIRPGSAVPAAPDTPTTLADDAQAIAAKHGVQIETSRLDDGLTRLSLIRADHPGKASPALDEFLAAADARGETVSLTPSPLGRGGLTKPQLTAWYNRRGFVPNKGKNRDFRTSDTLIREPVRPVDPPDAPDVPKGEHVKGGDGRGTITTTCPKCEGTGHLPEHSWYKEGICFDCKGSGIITSTEKQRLAKARREAKQLEKQKASHLSKVARAKANGWTMREYFDSVAIGDDQEFQEAVDRWLGAEWAAAPEPDAPDTPDEPPTVSPAASETPAVPEGPTAPSVAPILRDHLSNPDTERSRAVSAAEFQGMAAEGEAILAGMQAAGSDPNGLRIDWEGTRAYAFDRVQQPWGGVTIDAHTGQPLEPDHEAYGLTVKPAGLESVSVPQDASELEFNTAMDMARERFAAQLRNQGAYLGVFHDDDNNRIDIDPVVVVEDLHDAEAIGAHTRAVGGAYGFHDGNGYWPPHVDERIDNAGPGEPGQETGLQGPGTVEVPGGSSTQEGPGAAGKTEGLTSPAGAAAPVESVDPPARPSFTSREYARMSSFDPRLEVKTTDPMVFAQTKGLIVANVHDRVYVSRDGGKGWMLQFESSSQGTSSATNQALADTYKARKETPTVSGPVGGPDRPLLDTTQAARQYAWGMPEVAGPAAPGAVAFATNHLLRRKQELPPQEKQLAQSLDRAIQSEPALTEPLTVYRGIQADVLVPGTKTKLRSKLLAIARKSGTFDELGFMSTSTEEDESNNFLMDDNDIMLKIELPVGTKALHLDPHMKEGDWLQHEWLLPRGTRLRLSPPERSDQGHWLISATLESDRVSLREKVHAPDDVTALDPETLWNRITRNPGSAKVEGYRAELTRRGLPVPNRPADPAPVWYHTGSMPPEQYQGAGWAHLGTRAAADQRAELAGDDEDMPGGTMYRVDAAPKNPANTPDTPADDFDANQIDQWLRMGAPKQGGKPKIPPDQISNSRDQANLEHALKVTGFDPDKHDGLYYTNSVEDFGAVSLLAKPTAIQRSTPVEPDVPAPVDRSTVTVPDDPYTALAGRVDLSARQDIADEMYTPGPYSDDPRYEEVTIDPRDLIAGQDVPLNHDLLRKMVADGVPPNSDSPVVVARIDGKDYLIDGNHRAVVAAIRGENIEAYRIDLARTVPAPDPAPAPVEIPVDAEFAQDVPPETPAAPEWFPSAGLVTDDHEGRVGDISHITRNQHGTVPTASVATMRGVNGEVPGEHRNRTGPAWDAFLADVRQNGIKTPIFITVDPGEQPKISEGSHRRDAAVELGLADIPVHIRYYGHSELETPPAAETPPETPTPAVTPESLVAEAKADAPGLDTGAYVQVFLEDGSTSMGTVDRWVIGEYGWPMVAVHVHNLEKELQFHPSQVEIHEDAPAPIDPFVGVSDAQLRLLIHSSDPVKAKAAELELRRRGGT